MQKTFRRETRGPDKSISKTFMELDADLKAKGQELARIQRMSFTSLVENLLEAALKQNASATIASMAAREMISELDR
jgi:hypothetical protein